MICTKCRKTKQPAEFGADTRKLSGLSSWCRDCYRDRAAKRRVESPEKVRQSYARWLGANREQERLRTRAYQSANPAKVAQTRERGKAKKAANERQRRLLDPAATHSRVAKRRAARRGAVPAWSDLSTISMLYRMARCYNDAGIACHVDHIVPLQSPIVCGLHVPANLQLLPSGENISKGNRRWPQMPEVAHTFLQA